tara:strand:- start:12856 stop:13830 length:975 start_codon:yes stop_codon:yes gene_type:complete
MQDLDKLIQNFEESSSESDIINNPVGEEDIVFVHSSYHKSMGQVFNFPDNEHGIFMKLLAKTKIPPNSYQLVPAIKLAGIPEDDVDTKMLHKMRPILHDEMAQIKPRLIIPLGNIAMKALIKKSGLTNKRGREFMLGDFPVVPTYGPDTLFLEPKLRSLFIQDVNNAYDKFILDTNKLADSTYVLCKTISEVDEYLDKVEKCDVVAVDLETTGLDFKKDKITTIGFSMGEEEAFIIPLQHRETPFDEAELEYISKRISSLMANNDVAKVFHYCQFDLKFLMNFGSTTFNNIEDTKIMHALIDENLPHSLMDLVKQYFPHELEKF